MDKPGEISIRDSTGETVEIETRPGATLLELAVENSVDISHSCGGMGTCGTCRVRLKIIDGENPDRNEIEAEMASDRGYAADERLACQIECPMHSVRWQVLIGSESIVVAE